MRIIVVHSQMKRTSKNGEIHMLDTKVNATSGPYDTSVRTCGNYCVGSSARSDCDHFDLFAILAEQEQCAI